MQVETHPSTYETVLTLYTAGNYVFTWNPSLSNISVVRNTNDTPVTNGLCFKAEAGDLVKHKGQAFELSGLYLGNEY